MKTKINRKILLVTLLVSLVLLLSSTTVFAEEWKTDKGTPIPHRRLVVDPTDTDTYEYYDGTANPPVKVKIPDIDPQKLDEWDYKFRTEDFTENERKEIVKETKKDHPNIYKIKDPTKKYNCHGYTFGCGMGWINDPSRIIQDQGYKKVDPDLAMLGDIVVYKNEKGEITHTGKIVNMDPSKKGRERITGIRSKWGQDGLYDHKPGDVPSIYGEWEVYRGALPAKPAYPNVTMPVPPGENVTWGEPIDYLLSLFQSSFDPQFPYIPAVGGIAVPINRPLEKPKLSAPYIGLASTIIFATVAMAIYVKHVNRRKKTQ